MPRQPIPPPQKTLLSAFNAELVLETAIKWRKMEQAKHPWANFELDNLRNEVDWMLVRLINPPVSVPPPRKKDY